MYCIIEYVPNYGETYYLMLNLARNAQSQINSAMQYFHFSIVAFFAKSIELCVYVNHGAYTTQA